MEKIQKKRVHLLDEIRGFCIILVVIYHTMYDLVYLFNINIPIFNSGIMRFLNIFFAGLLIFIAGASCNFSKNNIKRGSICFGFGLILTVVTYLFMPSSLILFGILHMLGVCMILYGLFEKYINKMPPLLMTIVLVLLFVITYQITNGKISFFGMFDIFLPRKIYDIGFLFPFGFINSSFTSSDYFPLFPWVFCFFAGASIGRYLKCSKIDFSFAYKLRVPFLSYIGKKTLIIYILHQPIIYLVLLVIFSF